MKRTLFIPAVALTLMMASCGGGTHENQTEAKPEAEVAPATAESMTYTIDPASSSVIWSGSKVAGTHTGTINITTGDLMMTGADLTGGNFVLDMATLKNTDLEDAEKNGNLVGHLSSPDFFDVANNPTVDFAITGAHPEEDGSLHVSGNLTIKGITKNIDFPAMVNMTDNGLTAEASFSIDRTDWDIKYGSGTFFDDLGDKVINDNIDFAVKLVATK